MTSEETTIGSLLYQLPWHRAVKSAGIRPEEKTVSFATADHAVRAHRGAGHPKKIINGNHQPLPLTEQTGITVSLLSLVLCLIQPHLLSSQLIAFGVNCLL